MQGERGILLAMCAETMKNEKWSTQCRPRAFYVRPQLPPYAQQPMPKPIHLSCPTQCRTSLHSAWHPAALSNTYMKPSSIVSPSVFHWQATIMGPVSLSIVCGAFVCFTHLIYSADLVLDKKICSVCE